MEYHRMLSEAKAAFLAERPRCELCERRSVQVDHDHVSFKVRGALCRRCNSRIGSLEAALRLPAGLFQSLAGDLHRAALPQPDRRPGRGRVVAELGAEPIRFQASLEERGPATADRALAHLRSADCTAALCFGDRQAALLVAAARRAALSVPRDLALVAYDDEIADIPDVPLTAVAPPKHMIGRAAAELLLDRLRHPDHPRRSILIRPSLTIRQSCGTAAPTGR